MRKENFGESITSDETFKKFCQNHHTEEENVKKKLWKFNEERKLQSNYVHVSQITNKIWVSSSVDPMIQKL